jgi:hypothetical protein
MTNTKVVYTAITAGYDTLKAPMLVDDSLDYIVFTDDSSLTTVRPWQPVLIDRRERNPRITAKWYKIHPHLCLDSYESSLWIDGSCEIVGSLSSLMAEVLDQTSIAQFRHPDRSCIYDEAAVVKTWDYERPGIVDLQMACYQERGYPRNNGLFISGAIFRRHHEPPIRQAMHDWWRQIQLFSQRDQLSGGYILWKHDIHCGEIPGEQFHNPWFKWHGHSTFQSYLQTGGAEDELDWLRAAAAGAWEARQNVEQELRREAQRVRGELEKLAEALLPEQASSRLHVQVLPPGKIPSGAPPGGYLEAVEQHAGRAIRLIGWAMLDAREKGNGLILVTDQKMDLQSITIVERPDVVSAHEDPGLHRAGFRLLLASEDSSALRGDIQVFSKGNRYGLRKLTKLSHG